MPKDYIDQIIQMSKEIDAMNTLLESEWWTEECENANLHTMYGSYSILEELRNGRIEERDATKARSSLALDSDR